MWFRYPFPILTRLASSTETFWVWANRIYDLPDAGWIEFGSGSTSGNIAVTKAEVSWKPSTGTTVVFNVEDCNAACKELRRRGVRCENPVVFPGYVTFCSFYDPFGDRLQMGVRDGIRNWLLTAA